MQEICVSCDLFINSHCLLAIGRLILVALAHWDIFKSSTLVCQIDKGLEIFEEFGGEEFVAQLLMFAHLVSIA
jgi:hypothetical protein